jgi:NTE family protein
VSDGSAHRNGTGASGSPGPRVALVLPGGGARGAYEVGALSVLLPLLEARGERPVILCGTSVGAVNATALGATADRPADEAVASLKENWRGMRKGDVFRPVVGPGLPLTALRMIGEALEVPGVRLAGLLDPSPLKRSLDAWIDWDALHRNVRHGVVEAACVVATSLARSGPVAFVDSTGRVPPSRPADPLQYVPAVLDSQHVRASAAIPVLFPPVEVEHPAPMAGHYVDGGTRLNSPVAPALALGADRVVVIGFQPFRGRVEPGSTSGAGAPRLADVAANIIDGLLVDQVVDDLHRLATINSFVVDSHGPGPRGAADAYRAARGRKPYRRISYVLVAPELPVHVPVARRRALTESRRVVVVPDVRRGSRRTPLRARQPRRPPLAGPSPERLVLRRRPRLRHRRDRRRLAARARGARRMAHAAPTTVMEGPGPPS